MKLVNIVVSRHVRNRRPSISIRLDDRDGRSLSRDSLISLVGRGAKPGKLARCSRQMVGPGQALVDVGYRIHEDFAMRCQFVFDGALMLFWNWNWNIGGIQRADY